ncbi:MAG TPA: ATP-binding protein [Terracidiphilus sp.]|nr:ATP-binding protein [Terracidiphilus sp.]
MIPPPRHPPVSLCQTIPSRLGDAESLCLKIRGWLQAQGLCDRCFTVELLARECLTNAVIHGNGNAADKSVALSLSVGREWIRLTVCDEGPGFAWRKARRKRPDAALSSGRGLQLCALYAERVRFNRSGNQIALWIRKTAPTGKEMGKMAAYVVEQVDQQGSVRLEGDLTAMVVPQLQAELKELLNKGAHELVFDLSSTAMLDSSGMGLLIAAANSLAPAGGKIRVTNVGPEIFRLLQSMRLTARLNVSARA